MARIPADDNSSRMARSPMPDPALLLPFGAAGQARPVLSRRAHAFGRLPRI
jgi:hypothetical protein